MHLAAFSQFAGCHHSYSFAQAVQAFEIFNFFAFAPSLRDEGAFVVPTLPQSHFRVGAAASAVAENSPHQRALDHVLALARTVRRLASHFVNCIEQVERKSESHGTAFRFAESDSDTSGHFHFSFGQAGLIGTRKPG